MQKPPHDSILPRGAQARGQILGDRAASCPPKGHDATNFLAKLAARRDPSPNGVFINDLHEPSARVLEGPIQTHPDAKPVLGGSDPNASRRSGALTPVPTSPADVAVLALDQTDWRAPLLAYLLKEVLLPERTEARWIARCTKTFATLGDELYKQSLSGVLMKCIPTNQGKQLLLEVHAGICGHHAAPRSLVKKAFR